MDWLKYFFLSFFIDEYAEEAHKRSLLNSLLSLFISICILASSLLLGYSFAMDKNYRESELLREAAYRALTEGDGRLISEGGQFAFVDGDGGAIVKNNIGDGDGPLVIVDTRETENLFIEFELIYTNGENEISYEEYLALDASEKEGYAMTAEYSDRAIDFNSERISEYELYLSLIERAEILTQYNDLLAEKEELADGEYAIRLYELYVIAYYPADVRALDIYSFAPTLRTYYDDLIAKSMDGEFFALFSDLMYVRIANENTSYILSGHSENFDRGVFLSPETENPEESIDALIREAFDHSKKYILIEYLFNLVKTLPIFIILSLIISLISWVVFKLIKYTRMREYLSSFKLLNLYSICAALLAGIAGVLVTPSLGRAGAYSLSLIFFAAVITLRLAIYLIMKVCRSMPKEAEDES